MKDSPINHLQQLMCITMEECGELTQRCSKMMRKYKRLDQAEEEQLQKLTRSRRCIMYDRVNGRQ